jgi:hypothetical protein
MSEKIPKHLKVKHTCKNCRKKFTNRVIVIVDKNFLMSEITEALYSSPANLKSCKKCKSVNFDITYSFYHEEKIPHV